GGQYGAAANPGDTIAGSAAPAATDRSSASSHAKPDLAGAAPESEGSEESVAETPAKTADELIAEARQKMQLGDTNATLSLLKQAVAQDPKHRMALFGLCSVMQSQAMQTVGRGDHEAGYQAFLDSADYLRQLKQAHPDLTGQERALVANGMYNVACAHGINGDGEKALAAIRDAFDAGYKDLGQLDKDEDLALLRDMSAFQTLRQEHLERLREEAVAEAKQLLAEAESFPFDFTLNNLEDQPVSLADFKEKVVIVDFWGTWCPPCIKEIPHFLELREKYQADGLEIVGINYERVQPGETEKAKNLIKDFVAANNVTYQCLIGDEATQAKVPDLRGYPTTLFIDRAGKVRAKIVGYHDLINLEAIVNELLAEPAPPPGEAQAVPAGDEEPAAEDQTDAPAGEAEIEAEAGSE
ncbi:MAG: redoxin domain-containing protein, partial [Pirellulales bacterium]